MRKMREILRDPWFLIAAQFLLFGVIATCSIFYAYAAVSYYPTWKVVLLDVAFVFSCGALLALAWFEKDPEGKAWYSALSFAIGAGVYAALFFGLQAILDRYVDRSTVCFVGVALTIAFSFACVAIQDAFAFKRDRRFFLWASTALAAAVYAGTLVFSHAIIGREKDMTKVTAAEIESRFFCQGRRYLEEDRLFLNHSGASVEGVFSGTELAFVAFSEPIASDRNAYIRLTVDDKTERIFLPQGEKRIERYFPEGEHSFEIVKLTESANNSFALSSIETDGAFLPFDFTPSLRIEFIGDSISTGYGVLAHSATGEYKTKEQDVTEAFPYLTAKALGASYHVIAAGGWPIYRSKYSDCAIPDFYDNVDLLRNADKWDFSAFVPDYIVVTLGTNDYSYLADLSPEEQQAERGAIKQKFKAFLQKLLGQNAEIILIYGFYEYPDLGVLTEEVCAELDSSKIRTLEVESAASLSDVRAGHPGKVAHRRAAERLIALIESDLE